MTEQAPQPILSDAYHAKDASYYSGARADYVAELPGDGTARVLEIGCGDGATGAYALRQKRAGFYAGVEMFEPMAREAETVLSAVHTGNVETIDLPYARASFDALIMSEVLEHLVDPYAALARLVPFLKPGGRVFASSPNVAHWRIIVDLIRGRFEYQDSGPMDRTHLRWFTPASYRRLFEDSGLVVDRIGPVGGPPKRTLRGLLAGPIQHVRYFQLDVRAHRPGR